MFSSNPKVNEQGRVQAQALHRLDASDRASLLDELSAVKRELHSLLTEIGAVQESERTVKRELKLVEYARDAEAIKGNDLKQSLNAEKAKSLEFIERLNQETRKTNSQQEQLAELAEECARIKHMLEAQTASFAAIGKELEAERARTQQLKTSLKQQQQQHDENSKCFKTVSTNTTTICSNPNSELIQQQQQIEAKYDKLLKAYTEMKNAQIKLANLEHFQSTNNNLERIRQSLEFIALKHKDEIDSSSKSAQSSIKLNLNEIIKELEQCHLSTSIQINANHLMDTANGSNGHHTSNDELETKLIQQNRELINSIKKLTGDKAELRSVILKLEEELWTFRNGNGGVQKVTTAALSEHDREKFKKLYYKYLRAESFRKSLIYQKKFLLIMLSGYEETEREILSTLRLDSQKQQQQQKVRSGNFNHNQHVNSTTSMSSASQFQIIQQHQQHQLRHSSYSTATFSFTSRFASNAHKAKSRFRKAAICIIAINRIKLVIKHFSILHTG